MTALATISDVEAVLARATTTDEKTYIPRLIEMASARVVNELRNITWTPTTGITVTITPHDGVLRLPTQPVTSVTSITIAGSTIDPAQYEVREDGRILRTSPLALGPDSTWGMFAGPGHWPIDGMWPWPPTPTIVVFSAGYTYIPADIAQVVAELVAAKLEAGTAQAGGVMSETVTTGSSSYSAAYFAATADAWTPEQCQTLGRYKRTKVTSVRLG